MQYEELHSRFGSHTANKVVAGLTPSEFKAVSIENLSEYLELRAERARKEYLTWLNQGLLGGSSSAIDVPDVNLLHKLWCDAEELAYLIFVAEDVAINIRRLV